jgi:hypothetical protein
MTMVCPLGMIPHAYNARGCMNSPLGYLLLFPLNRYQPFKKRFLIPWLLSCLMITLLVTARDGTISKPDEVLVLFFFMVIPFSIGTSLGYNFDFFGAKTGVLKGWFWYLFPLIWWLPALQFVFNAAIALTGSSPVLLYDQKEKNVIYQQKLRDMSLEQFQTLFAPEIAKLLQHLETGALNPQQAEIATVLLKKNPKPSLSLGELLSDSSQNAKQDLTIFTELLFETLDGRRVI